MSAAGLDLTGAAAGVADCEVTSDIAAGISDLDLSVSAAGDALGTNITALIQAVGTRVQVE